jgi:hypothetical protein
LLRGRDNSKLPSVQTHPVYNRLIWNFTRDITGGEVAYALNYNIRNVNGDVAGTIDEADARASIRKGHGDAWGHYLTAIKNYYRLLRNPNFTWVPRIEAVIVGGVPVSVDYLDERKFAAAAAARARTGAEIVNLTFREALRGNPAKDRGRPAGPDPTGRGVWGVVEPGRPGGAVRLGDGQCAVARRGSEPGHTGIQKIERATMRELPEIAEAFVRSRSRWTRRTRATTRSGSRITWCRLTSIRRDCRGQDPLRPDQRAGERGAEERRGGVRSRQRQHPIAARQADDANSFQQRVVDQRPDRISTTGLIEIFGTPYTDDIGPTGTYPTGYAGRTSITTTYVDDPDRAAERGAVLDGGGFGSSRASLRVAGSQGPVGC